MELDDLFSNIYIRQAGVAAYDSLAEGGVCLSAITSSCSGSSIRQTRAAMFRLFYHPNWVVGDYRTATVSTAVKHVFSVRPKGAMVLAGDVAENFIRSLTPARPVSDYAFFAFPSFNGSPPTVIGSADAVVLVRNSQAARSLIEYLAKPQAAGIWARIGGFESPNRHVPLTAYRDLVTRELATALARTKVFRFRLFDLRPTIFSNFKIL